jgi:hypothetical protein
MIILVFCGGIGSFEAKMKMHSIMIMKFARKKNVKQELRSLY